MEKSLNARNDELFRRMKQCKKDSPEYLVLRDKIFSINQRMITIATRSYNKGNYYDMDDYRSEAARGLLKAIETFDPDNGNTFYTYSLVCMKSFINMYIRRYKRYNDTTLSIETVISHSSDRDLTLDDILGSIEPEEDIMKTMTLKEIKAYLPYLPERQRKVIELRYFDTRCLTQLEVADELKISRSYISRIEAQAIEKLKELMKLTETEG